MTKVMLELDLHEALAILDPIQHGALEDQRAAAKGKGIEAEYAGIRAQVRQRVAGQIVDAIFPDTMAELRREALADEIEFGLV